MASSPRVKLCEPSPVHYQDEPESSTQDWCVTQIKLKKFSYMWTITNFNVCNKMRECLTSSNFPANSYLKWCLRLNLKDKEKCFDIRLVLAQNQSPKSATVKFSFLNSKAEKKTVFEDSQYFAYGEAEGCPYRFTKEQLLRNNFLSGNKLTIFAEVKVIIDKANNTSQTYIPHFKDPECKLIENFRSILENGKFYDITFNANGEELRAHKDILAARSSVFAAMFNHEMQEKDKNVVNITDFNVNVLKEMLHFIYTGKAPNIDQVAHDLLAAADKYDLVKLKSMCELALYRTLSPKTAAETLILADLHHAKQLKLQTINFIKTYASNVESTPEWQNCIKTHPKLLSETGLTKSSNTF